MQQYTKKVTFGILLQTAYFLLANLYQTIFLSVFIPKSEATSKDIATLQHTVAFERKQKTKKIRKKILLHIILIQSDRLSDKIHQQRPHSNIDCISAPSQTCCMSTFAIMMHFPVLKQFRPRWTCACLLDSGILLRDFIFSYFAGCHVESGQPSDAFYVNFLFCYLWGNRGLFIAKIWIGILK